MTEISRLKSIVETLRSENGCSWDKVQTHAILKSVLRERLIFKNTKKYIKLWQ